MHLAHSTAIAFLTLLVAVPAASCASEPPVPVFDCRVPLAPLMDKLRASGGSVGLVRHVRNSADLTQLKSGARYKFSLPVGGQLALGPTPADVSGSVYSHPILSGGSPVLSAGGIKVEHDGRNIRKVTVDQDSQSYCPTADSLRTVLAWLAVAGVPREALRVENRPPECVEPNPTVWPPVFITPSSHAAPSAFVVPKGLTPAK